MLVVNCRVELLYTTRFGIRSDKGIRNPLQNCGIQYPCMFGAVSPSPSSTTAPWWVGGGQYLKAKFIADRARL